MNNLRTLARDDASSAILSIGTLGHGGDLSGLERRPNRLILFRWGAIATLLIVSLGILLKGGRVGY